MRTTHTALRRLYQRIGSGGENACRQQIPCLFFPPLEFFHMKQADAWLRPHPCPRWRDACCAGGEDGLLQRSRRACPLHISHTHHLSIIRPRPLGRHMHAHTLIHTHACTHALSSDRVVSKKGQREESDKCLHSPIWSLSYPVKPKTHQLLFSSHVVFLSPPIYLSQAPSLSLWFPLYSEAENPFHVLINSPAGYQQAGDLKTSERSKSHL